MLTNPTTSNSNQIMYPIHSRPSSLSIIPPSHLTSSSSMTSQQHTFFPLTTQNNTPTFTTAALPLLATPSTPIALTPNTVKTIEQSILQTLGEDAEESYMMESQQYSGNFVPPLPSSTSTITLINTWQGGQVSSDGVGAAAADDNEDDEMKSEMKPFTGEDEGKSTQQESSNKKRKPARKPAQQQTKGKQEAKQTKKAPARSGKKGGNKTTEEDERRRVRRERNKLAAARCRKRRVDHTNKLLEETEGLDAKKRALQNQITELQSVKVDLEFLLENHPCVKNKIRSEVLADLQNLPRTTNSSSMHHHHHFIGGKPKRPSTLNVSTSSSDNTRGLINVTTPAPPITISTPSNGIAGLGFEPLCPDWGVSISTPDGIPTSTAEKSSAIVPVSSSSFNNNDTTKGSSLVTPVNPFKKLQDL